MVGAQLVLLLLRLEKACLQLRLLELQLLRLLVQAIRVDLENLDQM